MKNSDAEVHLRYPMHARLLICITWLFYAAVLLPLALFMLPIVPLAPAFVMIMVALGGLLSSVHEYARSVARPAQRARLLRLLDGKIPEATHGAAHSN